MRASVIALLLFMSCRDEPSDWDGVKAWVRSEFPEVEQISSEELVRRLDTAPPFAPILLDVRTEEEYAVSHLPGAIRIEPGGEVSDILKALDREAPVVTYCSVGYRSSQLAERLSRAGFTNVANLEGSIFEWANEGYPLVRGGEPVYEVHPFDEEWGRWLDRSLHAYEPEGRRP